jgi:hypothetical protein
MPDQHEILTEADIIALNSQTPAELARGYCTLNSWGWPEWLPDPMSLEDRHKPGLTRSLAAMAWIKKRVGERVVNREWNSHMTDDEHEDFWRGTREGDADAMARYEARWAFEDEN